MEHIKQFFLSFENWQSYLQSTIFSNFDFLSQFSITKIWIIFMKTNSLKKFLIYIYQDLNFWFTLFSKIVPNFYRLIAMYVVVAHVHGQRLSKSHRLLATMDAWIWHAKVTRVIGVFLSKRECDLQWLFNGIDKITVWLVKVFSKVEWLSF